MVELLQDYVRGGHPERAVASGVEGHPLIRVLADLAKVGGEDHRLRPIVARLREKVTIRCACHVQARAHVRNHLRIVPVCALADVGLLTPDFGESRRKVTVPVVEAQIDTTEELQKSAARSVTEHRHSWNGAKTNHAIRSIFLGRVNVSHGHDLHDLIPGGATKSTLPPSLLIGATCFLIILECLPGCHRVTRLAFLLSIAVQ